MPIGWKRLLQNGWILTAYWDLKEEIGKLVMTNGNIVDDEYMGWEVAA